jgi:hypothetical protein
LCAPPLAGHAGQRGFGGLAFVVELGEIAERDDPDQLLSLAAQHGKAADLGVAHLNGDFVDISSSKQKSGFSLIASRTGVSGPAAFGDDADGDIAVGDHANQSIAFLHRTTPASALSISLAASWMGCSGVTTSGFEVMISDTFMGIDSSGWTDWKRPARGACSTDKARFAGAGGAKESPPSGQSMAG